MRLASDQLKSTLIDSNAENANEGEPTRDAERLSE